MDQQKQQLALNILQSIVHKKSIQLTVEDYKTSYYKILLEAYSYKTRPTVEKLFFNSKISPLKVLWLIKLMYEKEKLKVPEQTKAFLQSLVKIIEYGKTKKEREAFSMLDRDKYLQRIFDQIVQKKKKDQSQKLKDFLKNYSNHHKYSNAINLLFVVEKTYQRNLNNHFNYFKSMTSKNFNTLSKATHFIVESMKNRMFGKQSKILNLLKLHSQKKKQLQAGLQRFRMFHEIHQKKKAKRAFNDILRFSISKNNSIIETEAKIYLNFKNLERIVSMGELKSKIQAVRAFQNEIKDFRKLKKKAIKRLFANQLKKKKNLFQNLIKNNSKNQINKALFLNRLEDKLNMNFKKTGLKQLQTCQNQSDIKLFKNYLQKWKENNITVKALNRKNYEIKKQNFIQNIKNKVGGIEKILLNIKKRNLRSSLNEMIKDTSEDKKIIDQNNVIQNTLTLANLVNYLDKKRKIDKFLALYKWRENAKKQGTYRYIKSKDELNESEIQFEYLPDYNYGNIDVDILKQQKQKIFLTMLEYIFLKRKAQGMRCIALEANRIKTKEVLKIFRLLIREIQLKKEMYWWRRLKANMNHKRIEERKKKLNLQKKIEIKAFKKIQKLY